MRILVINGPSLNLLGLREPEIYGKETYEELTDRLYAEAEENGWEIDIVQTNHEGVIVDWIQDALGEYDGIVINAAAYTHTSIAIADALRAVRLPAVEVHLSDLTKREDYRRVSYLRDACIGCEMGEGIESYRKALHRLADHLNVTGASV